MIPGISIVIPTYDRPRRLARALESCLAQTERPLEIIVANNGNNPGTNLVISEAGKRSREVPIRKLQAKPFDLRSALSDGIEKAEGDWTILLDDDDFLAPDRIENDTRIIGGISLEEILVIHDFLRVDYRNSLVWEHRMKHKQLSLAEALVLDNFPPPPAGTWRSSELQQYHPFRIAGGWTDFDLYATMLQHGELVISHKIGYIMDDTRVAGRLTTNPEQTMRMVELHRERYRDIRDQADASNRALGRRLNEQQAFFAGKALGFRALFGPSANYCRRHPKEFAKGVLAPCRNWVSRIMPNLLPEMRGSKTCSLSHFERYSPSLGVYLKKNHIRE